MSHMILNVPIKMKQYLEELKNTAKLFPDIKPKCSFTNANLGSEADVKLTF